MKIALLGYGYWGASVAQTLDKLDGCTLHAVLDPDWTRADLAKSRYRLTDYASYDDLLRDESIEAIVCATPPETHYDIARKALLADKHLLLEKPFTTRLDHACSLLDLAESRGLVAMADYVFMYAEPVRFIKSNIGQFGDIVYINMRRVNLGIFQYATDVIRDLAVHDLSIVDYLVGLDIRKVNVFKRRYRDFPNDALANIDLELTNDIIVSINVSWLSPVKVREVFVGGVDMTAIYDDTMTDKLRLYDTGVVARESNTLPEVHAQLAQRQLGEAWCPALPSSMPLTNACRHFLECVRTGRAPDSGRDVIMRVTTALEKICAIG